MDVICYEYSVIDILENLWLIELMSTTTLNLTPQVYQYFQNHGYREPEILTRLRQATAQQFPNQAQMEISPEQGQLMALLVTLLKAQKVLEIGTFTGYSALVMAMALPSSGQLITCDIDPAATALANDFWRQAGLETLIELKLQPAMLTLQTLLDEGQAQSFDFAFIDADKTAYDSYYEHCLQLVRPGGIIAIDNTLQNGAVADSAIISPNVVALRELNDKLLHDDRIFLSMLPISDGLTLAYKR